MLGLGYPGGAILEKMARLGDSKKYKLPVPIAGHEDRKIFTYSGLKTAVRNFLAAERAQGRSVRESEVAAAFQEAVVRDLVDKTLQAARETGAAAVALTGGVAANSRLRERLSEAARRAGLECYLPPRAVCTDNAAMIAAAGAEHLAAGERDAWDLAAVPYLELGSG